MNNYNPYCPNCGAELEFFDHTGTEDCGDIIIAYARGSCTHCGKKYIWEDIYTLDTFERIEENDW